MGRGSASRWRGRTVGDTKERLGEIEGNRDGRGCMGDVS